MSLILFISPFSLDPLYEMTPSQAKQIVYAQWVASWGATTAYRLDNETFKPGDLAEGSPWASLTVETVAQGRQHTLGNVGARKFERQMILFIEIHTPTNTGTQLSDDLTSLALTTFEGWRDGGIYAREVSAPRQGNNGRDYVVVVEISFTYYELK